MSIDIYTLVQIDIIKKHHNKTKKYKQSTKNITVLTMNNN